MARRSSATGTSGPGAADGKAAAAVQDGKATGEASTALAEGAASPGAVGEVAAATALTGGGVAAADLTGAAAGGAAAAAGATGAASALAEGLSAAGGGGPAAEKGANAAAGEAKGAAPAGGGAAGGGAAKTATGGPGGDGKPAAAGPAAPGGEAKATSGGPAATAAAPSGGAAGPVDLPKPNKDPHADPAFQAMKGRSKGAAGGAKAHTPAKAGAANAQGAAAPPSNDASSQAQAAQVDEMSTKEPGAFDREAFIAAVRQAIEKQAPKNLEEADEFKEGGADGVKTEVSGHVKKGKEGSEKDIKDSTNAPPDASKAKPKPVEPMVNDQPGAGEKTVGAQGAMPPPTPAAHTDLSAGPDSIDAKMADAEVTEEQLKKSNEPTFNEALGAKGQAKEHADAAPADFKKDEKGVLAKAKGDAAQLEGTGLTQMQGSRGQALNQAVGHKEGAKTADEAKRAKVANDIQGIYDRTKADVTKTLDGLDGKVDAAFAQGEGAARKKFEDYVGQRMDAYKEDRYGGLFGGAKWLKDKLFGMPSEVNAFYAEGKTRYLADMDGVIGKIADIVGTGLNGARARIAQGKAEIAKYVAQLPQDLKKVGQEAESKLESQFEQLESDIESKQSEMVDTLARKYVESRDALDARIDEMKAANRGLIDKAMDAIAGVIKTIIQLKNMLLGVLAKAAGVIGRHPGRPDRLPQQPDRRHQGGPVAVRRQHRRPPPAGPDGLAHGRARQRGHRAAQDVRHQGHLQPRPAGARPHLREHPRARRQAGRRAGGRQARADRRHLQDPHLRGPRRPVALRPGPHRRPRRDGHRRHQGLHHREGHQGRHHLADRLHEPRRRLHQGLQGDLRHHHVPDRARQRDHGLRQLGPGLDRRGRQGQHRGDGVRRSRTAWPRRCR